MHTVHIKKDILSGRVFDGVFRAAIATAAAAATATAAVAGGMGDEDLASQSDRHHGEDNRRAAQVWVFNRFPVGGGNPRGST